MATPVGHRRREVQVNKRTKELLRKGQLFRCAGCGVLHETRGECDSCEGRGPVPLWTRGAR